MGNWVLFWEQKSLADRCEDFGQSQDSIKYGGFLNWVIVHCLLQRDIVTRTQIISCFVIVQLCPSFTFTVLLKNNFCAREKFDTAKLLSTVMFSLFGQTDSVQFFTRFIQYFFFYWRYNPLWFCIQQPSSGAIASSRTRFLDHTQRRATVGRTPLDE